MDTTVKKLLIWDGVSLDSQNRPVLWKVPDGITVALGQAADPSGWDWDLYSYSEGKTLSTDCGAGPIVDNGAPVWGVVSPPDAIAGSAYKWVVPLTAATASVGHSMSSYEPITLPPFLSAVHADDLSLVIYGNIPAGTTGPIVISLTAIQDNGKGTANTINIGVGVGQIYAKLQYVAGNRTAILRVGPYSPSAPYGTLTGPAGWSDTAQHQGNPSSDVLNGVPYPYYFYYPAMPDGTYVEKLEYLSQTLYATWTVAGANQEADLTLTTSPPGNVGNYFIEGIFSINEGSNQTFTGKQQQGVNSVEVADYTLELQGAREGTVLAGKTVSVAPNSLNGDSYQATLILKVAGVQKAQQLLNIVDTSPLISNPDVLAIDYKWARNNPAAGQQSTMQAYIKALFPDQLEMATQSGPAGGPYALPKSSYSGYNVGDYGNGYNILYDLYNAPSTSTLTIFVRKKGTSTDLVTVTIGPFPSSGTVARTTVYTAPNGSGNGSGNGNGNGGGSTSDLYTAPAISGTASGGYPSNSTYYLNMAYDVVNGRITNLRNTATPNVSSGYGLRYLFNSRWYAYQNNAWYRIVDNNGSLASQPTNLSFSVRFMLLVQVFLVPLNRPVQGGQGNPGWRDNPIDNASQGIRIQ